MHPHEIKPDTQLCTILGYNAQTGKMRKYFNKIMKHNHKNATAIALNIADEHFTFTMENVGKSKVDKMMIEHEFAKKAIAYCDVLNPCAKEAQHVDFVEVKEGKVHGYCMDDEAKALFENSEFLDEQIVFAAKILLVANRWFESKIEVDFIPLLIGDK
jgi:shikimate 5-dehydrogenase